MSLPWIGLLWSRYIDCPLKFDVNTLPGVTWMARGGGAQVLLLPPSGDVPPPEPDVTEAPDAPEAPDAAPAAPLEALPLLTTPLVTPPEVLPLVTRPLVAAPDELPLVGAPLIVPVPVLPPEPEGLTDPDEPDGEPPEPVAPEDDPLLPEDPEPTVAEGVFEPEHARPIVIPAQNNPERHLKDMGPPRCKHQDQDGRRPASTAETRIQIPCSLARAMWAHERRFALGDDLRLI
jgi:hypothetical protein